VVIEKSGESMLEFRELAMSGKPQKMKRHNQHSRRGAASVVLSGILLVLVTATALTTLRGQMAAQQAAQEMQTIRTLNAAIQAAQSLPDDLLKTDLHLPLDSQIGHEVVVSMIQDAAGNAKLKATEHYSSSPFKLHSLDVTQPKLGTDQ
jgi:hypothetical protein